MPAPAIDMSCDAVCRQTGLVCAPAALAQLNTCAIMTEHFGCSACQSSYGPDQPAFLKPSSSADSGLCLLQERAEMYSCAGKHKDTMRLCACVPR